MTPHPRPSPCALADLEVGDEAVVTDVQAPAAEVERLAALGLVPGACLRLLCRGATLAVAVGAARIALSRRWAEALAVVPV